MSSWSEVVGVGCIAVVGGFVVRSVGVGGFFQNGM
jgi:hypothetical protein